MGKISNGIDKVRHPAIRNTAGTGYVVLNTGLEKEDYIRNCYRNSTLSIITENNEIIKNVIVSKEVWQYIEFPNDIKERGSCVVWLNIHTKNKPVILAVINKKDQLNEIQTANSFKLDRNNKNNNSSVSIEGLGDKGVFNLITSGDDENESEVNIKIINSNAKGKFDLLVQGGIAIEADDNAKIKLKNDLEIEIKDEQDKTKSMSFKMKDKKFNLSNEQTSLKKLFIEVVKMYLNTKTIDGKPLDASSIQKANSVFKEIGKLF